MAVAKPKVSDTPIEYEDESIAVGRAARWPSPHLRLALFICGCLAEQDYMPIRQHTGGTNDLELSEYATVVRLIASCLENYGVEIPNDAGLPFKW